MSELQQQQATCSSARLCPASLVVACLSVVVTRWRLRWREKSLPKVSHLSLTHKGHATQYHHGPAELEDTLIRRVAARKREHL